MDYQPTDPQVAWFLSRFIGDIRTVSLDPVLMRQDWLSAYDFTTKRGAIFLGDYARSADPFGRVGERTISVQVTSVVRARSEEHTSELQSLMSISSAVFCLKKTNTLY